MTQQPVQHFLSCCYFLIIFTSCILLPGCSNNEDQLPDTQPAGVTVQPPPDMEKLREKAKEAKAFCRKKQLNTDFYLVMDLQRHSGLKRFFIWDFKKDSIIHALLVSHGCGKHPWGRDQSKDAAAVSNEDGSHASSIGKYIVAERAYSNWGIHVKYVLNGQDATNSNAFKRLIVLHSWESVPDKEVFPAGTPEGWGCPALSNAGMQIVDEKLTATNKQVLLWVIQ